MRASSDTDVTIVENSSGPTQAMIVMAPAVSRDPIPMKLNYLRAAGGIELVWSMVLRTPDGHHWYDVSVNATTGQVPFVSDWVEDASYEAFNFNLENPDDGPRTFEFDPHLAAPNASPFGWHDTNGLPGAEFTDTRGNNVSAQEDRGRRQRRRIPSHRRPEPDVQLPA